MHNRSWLVSLAAFVLLSACVTPSADATVGTGESGGSAAGESESHGTGTGTGDSETTSAMTAAPCSTWCGGYPVEPGCDEDDDGVRSDESGGGDDTGAGMGDDIPLGVTIYEVQQGGIDLGTLVELADVIVTAPAAPEPRGSGLMFTVAEANGGPYSGITVRVPPDDVIAMLQPGDTVTIVGRRTGRYIFSLIESESAQVTITGSGELPDPVVIPAEELASLSAGSEVAATLESVVVKVLEPLVLDTDPCAGELELEAALRIDDRFLVANGETLSSPAGGAYASVMGPLLYTYNGFEIAPRNGEDLED